MAFANRFAACLLDRHREKMVYVAGALLARDAVTVGLLRIDGLDLDIVVTNDVNFLYFLRLRLGSGAMGGSWLAGPQISRQRFVLGFYFLSRSANSSAYLMPMISI